MSYKGHKILAVIPARGGSKGIPRKNLCKIAGTSLVGHAANVARSLDWIDRTVVSTDDVDIAAEGRRYGAEVPFIRPEELSGMSLTQWTCGSTPGWKAKRILGINSTYPYCCNPRARCAALRTSA